IDFVAQRLYRTAIEISEGVVELLVLDPRRADQNGWAGNGLLRQGRNRRSRLFLERRLQHQVFRRIAADEELGEENEVRALRCYVGTRLPGLGEVARNVADDGIELSECDLEGGGHDHRNIRRVERRFRDSTYPPLIRYNGGIPPFHPLHIL